MASTSTATESSPLLPKSSIQSTQTTPPRPPRTVTFNPTVQSNSPTPSSPQSRPSPPMTAGAAATTSSSARPGVLSDLGSRLRRRHSQGTPIIPTSTQSSQQSSRIGPQRTTKTAEKLKILPDPEQGEDGPDEESGRDVYAQFTRIKDPTARRDAARLGKPDRERLPRVTAYCTAGSYRIDQLMRYLKGKSRSREAAPKRFDECLYTPFRYDFSASNHSRYPKQQRSSSHAFSHRRYSDSAVEDQCETDRRETLIDMGEEEDVERYDHGRQPFSQDDANLRTVDFDIEVHIPEIFLFDYGTVVIWGMTRQQEDRFLRELSKFEVEKLDKDSVQTEDFNFYYTREYQARIYNDFISLRDKKNYMTKLAISHALSQSVKTSLYETLVDATIEVTKDIPSQIALTGKINLTRREINMQIGELFNLRINIHLQGSVLDAPELMWAEPQLEPVYGAVRSYLEMDQRVKLLMDRLDVIADLLAVLKDQLGQTHGEYLEWIVIVLIAAEIVVAAINIVVDLYAGVD